MVTNKRIKTTESLQMRFENGSKNLVIKSRN
mgnify:FL=1